MKPFTINIRGRLVGFDRPAVMGIINVTDDSFYADSRVSQACDIAARAVGMVADGADIIDIGAYSSRPGAHDVPEVEETRRLISAIEVIRKAIGPDIPLSVDTFRASVARECIEIGADIVNDISGGLLDARMFETVAALHCPYILMHMRGTPATMQSLAVYNDVTADVIRELSHRLYLADEAGIADVIVDPGFGFAKTLEQNYAMLHNLEAFGILERPLLVGVSRKSMITKLLDIDVADACTPTAVLGAFALDRGASVLRVHDVRAAAQSVKLYQAIGNSGGGQCNV